MESRGQLSTFLVGLPIAFFSGLGVAVSLLDDQTNSLVGVAISASLLPPAVNAGILWVSYAFVEADILERGDSLNTRPAPLSGGDLIDPHTEDRTDYRQMGVYSLSLTLANIVLIWISSMLMFRLKERLPIKKNVFWDDLAVARKIYEKRAVLQTTNNVDDLETGLQQQQEDKETCEESTPL